MNPELMMVGNVTSLDLEALKKKYLECFETHTCNASNWREAATALVDRGFSRGTLLKWGMEAGYEKEYVSKVLSEILCPAGRRERKSGGGRKTPAEALALLAYAQGRYAENCRKMLRAALWAEEAQRLKILPEPQELAVAVLKIRDEQSELIPDGNKENEAAFA